MPLSLDLMPLEEKPPEAPAPKTIVVRYGYLKEIGEFPSDLTTKVGCGSKLIIRTDRGTEIGEMLTTLCGNGGCNKSITREKFLDYIEKSGARDYPLSEAGRVLRPATVQDLAEQSKLDENRKKHIDLARDLVRRHNLQMKIVDVEHILGGERILYYFTSEQRIDFRSLVRDLAHELHTRIELRQVGARDEARITADYEKCGQHCCCKQFLKVLTPISMRSAKVQKATLDPTKISGRCGRLMCCLRYEDETYEELRKKLPKRNTRVKTEAGDAWVIDGQILTQLVLCQFDDGKREAVPMEKIVAFDQPKPVMSDGRTMQTPNDRPPMDMINGGPAGPGGRPPRGPRPQGAPPMQRPKPGAPAQGPVGGGGDPLAAAGSHRRRPLRTTRRNRRPHRRRHGPDPTQRSSQRRRRRSPCRNAATPPAATPEPRANEGASAESETSPRQSPAAETGWKPARRQPSFPAPAPRRQTPTRFPPPATTAAPATEPAAGSTTPRAATAAKRRTAATHSAAARPQRPARIVRV